MSGEIHNFNKKRKRPRWQDDRNTDKYYDSGDVSAIRGQDTVSDSIVKPGEQPQAKPTKQPRKDDRRADKYYENQIPLAPTKQQIARGIGLGQKPELGLKRQAKPTVKNKLNTNSNLIINNNEIINDILQEVVNRLDSGDDSVVVYIEKGNSQLLRRVRTALELLVTRQMITEDQYHAVRLSYTMDDGEQAALNAKLGVPQPRGEKTYQDNATEEFIDPEDFLSGKVQLNEEEIDTTPTQVVEVDTSNDVKDAEDDDFLINKIDPVVPVARPKEIPKIPDSDVVSITESKETPEKTEPLSKHIKATESMEGIGGNTKKHNRKHGRKH